MEARAVCRNFGMSAKKVRRLLGLIQGRPVDTALSALRFHPSPAAEAIRKTLGSAVANAENNHMLIGGNLKVVAAFANDAPVLKRFRPQSRGRVNPIRRQFSHITVIVDERDGRNGA